MSGTISGVLTAATVGTARLVLGYMPSCAGLLAVGELATRGLGSVSSFTKNLVDSIDNTCTGFGFKIRPLGEPKNPDKPSEGYKISNEELVKQAVVLLAIGLIFSDVINVLEGANPIYNRVAKWITPLRFSEEPSPYAQYVVGLGKTLVETLSKK